MDLRRHATNAVLSLDLTQMMPSCLLSQGVSGVVEVLLAPGKKLEHLGIKIELVGTIGERIEHTETRKHG